MTRLINTGFETGDKLDFTSTTGTVQTSIVYTGGYALGITGSAAFDLPVPVPGDVLYLSFFLYTDLGSSSIIDFMRVRDISGVGLLEFSANISGVAYLYRSGTLLATSSSPVFQDLAWHHVEIFVTIADSGGRGVLKVNGVTVIDFTGDTKPGTNTDIYTFAASVGNNFAYYYDDLVVNDDGGSAPDNTYPGRVRLFPLRPTGAGNYTQWDRGGTDSGANWSQVEEVPASSVDYVTTTVDDEIDSYALANLSGLPAGASFKSVIVVAEAMLDSGSKKLALGVRSGSTDSFGADKGLGTSYSPKYERFTTDPADSNPWTETDINAVEAAIKSRA